MPSVPMCHQPAKADHAQLYEIPVGELTDFVVFLLNPTGCIVSWNPGVERMLGYTEAEWLGRSVERIFTPEDWAQGKHQEEMTVAARDGRAPDIRWHLRKNGERFYVEGTMVALRDEAGQLLGFSKVMRDITERKQTEDALRDSQQESERLRAERDQQLQTFNTVLARVQEYVYLFDREGRFRYLNQPLLDLWGLTREQAVGKTCAELGYPEELVRLHEEQLRRVVATGQPVEGENAFTSPAGVTGYYEYTFVPLFAPDGSVEAVGGHTRDATERRKAEAVLRESEARLGTALAIAQLGTFEWNVRTHTVVLDARSRAIFGFGPGEGRTAQEVFDRIHPDDFPRVRAEAQTSQERRSGLETEYRILLPGGAVRTITSIHQVNFAADGTVERMFGVFSDITERKQAEKAQRRSHEELQRVNRELEEFAYVASHDLQEPLRMVNIYTQLILKRLAGNDTTLDEYAGFVRHGVTRMEELIRDLLTYSRTVQREELPVGTADLSASFHEAVTVLQNRIEESGATITAPPLPTVRGDTKQMAHVFQNLLSNALKYRQPDTVPQIEMAAERDGAQWIVSVRDNGIGFEPQYAERIFGLFKRLHTNEYPGTGLGLAICQRIIERSGGRLWAEGRPGQGATFFFALPSAEENASHVHGSRGGKG